MNHRHTLNIVAVFAIVLGIASHAFAQQPKINIKVQPANVTVKEIFNINDDGGNALKHVINPMMLDINTAVGDSLQLRGRVALPGNVSSFPVQYQYRDDAKKLQSLDQQHVDLRYRDFGLGMQWQPMKKLGWGYALVSYETTSYRRSAFGIGGIVINGQEVITDSSVQYTYQTLSIGVGVAREFKKFGFRAETSVAPLLSQINYHSKESNNTGFKRENRNADNGHGKGLLLNGSYYVSKHVGISGTVNVQTFRYQNEFMKNNHIQPETRWNTYAVGVVTRF